MNVNCLNLLASLGRHAPNYRSFRSFRFVCHLLKVSMSSSEKKRTISSTKRDQKTGENRDSWRRSFDSEAEASSHPLIEYPSVSKTNCHYILEFKIMYFLLYNTSCLHVEVLYCINLEC